MSRFFQVNKNKNFTPLTDTIFSLDKNPELRKKVKKIVQKILTDNNMQNKKNE